MGSLKSPLLSLGARGTIGDTLTLQKRGRGTIVRKKPIPAYRYTLLQAYQRWLYEDYAYLWRQQSQATRQFYATAGTRIHLTGFQYWMKVMLLTMPDIVGWWRLDEGIGAVAHDSIPDPHHGVIIGASPADGVIAGAYSFDGLNDYIIVDPPPLVSLTACTILFFLNIPAFDGTWRMALYWGLANPPYGSEIMAHPTLNTLYGYLRNTAGVFGAAGVTFTPDTWELRGVVWDGTNIWQVRNSDLLLPQAFTGTVAPTAPLYLGKREPQPTKFWHDGYQDSLIIYNRALDATEIARWAGRRYPP